jgi:hypothetical protein
MYRLEDTGRCLRVCVMWRVCVCESVRARRLLESNHTEPVAAPQVPPVCVSLQPVFVSYDFFRIRTPFYMYRVTLGISFP